MSRVDDLNVGDYVAVTAVEGDYETRRGEPICTREPILILAISLPFVAVRDTSNCKVSIDTRVVVLQKLSKEYARVFIQGKCKAKSKKIEDINFKSNHPMCRCEPIHNPHLPEAVVISGQLLCPKCRDEGNVLSRQGNFLVCPKCEQRVNIPV